MAKRRRRPSQSWKTFLRNRAEGIAALDLFVASTADLRVLFALIIVHIDRRLLVTKNVTTRATAAWIARQVTEVFPWDRAPKYLIRDRDGAYGHAFRRRLRAMGVRDRPTAPRSPLQKDYVEQLIGSIHRESLDHVIVLGEPHLRRVLRDYAAYYNDLQTHLSLAKDARSGRGTQRIGCIIRRPILEGLHHHYVRR